MSRNVGFRGFWMFWWGRCFRLLFSRRLCWELPCEGEFGWVVVEGWGVIGNFWISGHLPKCRRMRTWWRFLWVFVVLMGQFLQWYVSRVSEACTKGNFRGSSWERQRESLAGLSLRGGLERKILILCIFGYHLKMSTTTRLLSLYAPQALLKPLDLVLFWLDRFLGLLCLPCFQGLIFVALRAFWRVVLRERLFGWLSSSAK